jgi:hypothetical protein
MTTATQPEVQRGFQNVPCLKCMEVGTVSIDLCDLETCRCSACCDEFTTDEVRTTLAVWARVLDWIDLAPTRAD